MNPSSSRGTPQRTRRRRTAVLVLIAAATLVAGGMATTPVQASRPPVRGPQSSAAPTASTGLDLAPPVLDWHSCFGGDLECTRATVPLDYDDPVGATTSIFMSRLPATDPANRIGTLFINPGGPGGPSSQFHGVLRETPGT